MSTKRYRFSGFSAGLVLGTAAIFGISSSPASAEEIARWVDAQGVTHFGNTQFAPETASRVNIKSANRMDVPQNNLASSNSSGPTWTVIARAPKQNKKGWRGKGDGPHNGPIARSSRY